MQDYDWEIYGRPRLSWNTDFSAGCCSNERSWLWINSLGEEAKQFLPVSYAEQKMNRQTMADCSFSKMVLAQRFNLPMINQNTSSTRIKEWWSAMIGQGDDRRRTRTVIYAVWNIWKEHCRGVFDDKSHGTDSKHSPRRWHLAIWYGARKCSCKSLKPTSPGCCFLFFFHGFLFS